MVKKLKIIVVLLAVPLLFAGFSNCGGAPRNASPEKSFVQNPPFKIAEAYYQDWVAGVQEGGSGTNIHVSFAEMQPDVTVQHIYFRNQMLEAKGNINEPKKFVGYLKKDAQRDVIMDADPLKEAQNTPSKPFPFQLESNEAVLEYWFEGEKHFYKISNLSQKEMIPYPQANPNSHE